MIEEVETLIKRYSASVCAETYFMRLALTIARGLQDKMRLYRSARVVASAVLYMASKRMNLSVTQREIWRLLRVSDAAMRCAYYKLSRSSQAQRMAIGLNKYSGSEWQVRQ